VAHHALLAGDTERAAQLSLAAAQEALGSHAPEEALRLVDLALPMIAAAGDRLSLLCLRDEALEMLRRPDDRLERLAELAALAEAMGDPSLEVDVTLRRSAALRAAGDFDRAAELARRVAESASGRADKPAELRAQLEIGQALMRSELGETYTPNPTEADFEGTQAAYTRALELAQELGDRHVTASAERELGVLASGRVRAWFVEQVSTGAHIPVLRRLVSGERLEDIAPTLPIFPDLMEAFDRLPRAAKMFEELGDRRGLMSAIIALAYVSWGPDVHMPGSPKRIEEIRRLATEMTAITKASERELAEAQMLYGVHVYSRAKGFPDLAISRGEDAYQAARSIGDRGLEFSAAGGVALSYADVGDTASASTWLDRAASVAAAAPTPRRARQIELWRGLTLGAAGDASMRQHLETSAQLASDQGRVAARCEARAWLASWAAFIGARTGDHDLLDAALAAAEETKTLGAGLSGRPTWGAQADAAIARVALARGDVAGAVASARAALSAMDAALTEDSSLQIVLPAAKAILAGGEEAEKEAVLQRMRLMLDAIAQRFMDDEVRVRWFRGPWGSELAALAGPPTAPVSHDDGAGPLDEEGTRLMTLVVEGKSNAEIAQIVGLSEETVAAKLAALFASLGATSRADATAFALMGRMI
jgi:DNA-binding NarL/FixJ family response regulator